MALLDMYFDYKGGNPSVSPEFELCDYCLKRKRNCGDICDGYVICPDCYEKMQRKYKGKQKVK